MRKGQKYTKRPWLAHLKSIFEQLLLLNYPIPSHCSHITRTYGSRTGSNIQRTTIQLALQNVLQQNLSHLRNFVQVNMIDLKELKPKWDALTDWLTDLSLSPIDIDWLMGKTNHGCLLCFIGLKLAPPPLQLERVRPLNSASPANWLQTKSSRSFIRVDVLVTLSLYLPTISLYDFKLPFAYNFKPRLMKRMFDILCCSESLSKNIWRHQNHFACSGWKYARYVLTVGR